MLHLLWRHVHCRQETSEDAECVLNDAPCMRQKIVEDPLIICDVVDGKGFHHPLTQQEYVVAYH